MDLTKHLFLRGSHGDGDYIYLCKIKFFAEFISVMNGN